MKNRLRIGLGLSSALLASLLISKPVYAEGYKASNAEKTLKIVNLNDLEGQVKASMDKGAFARQMQRRAAFQKLAVAVRNCNHGFGVDLWNWPVSGALDAV